MASGPPALALGTRVIWRIGLAGNVDEWQPVINMLKIARTTMDNLRLNPGISL